MVTLTGGCDSGSEEEDAGRADAGVATVDAGEDAGAGTMDAGPPAGDAGPAMDAGPSGSDAGAGSDAGPTPADGGAVVCGTDPVPPARRFPESCLEPRCYGEPACATAVLEGWGFNGYTACGRTYTFDPVASQTACSNEPFGGFQYPASCGRIDYTGSVRLYCAPDRSVVVAYFWGTATETLGGFLSFMHYGHEYASGPSSGSGTYSDGEAAPDFRSLSFQGIQDANVSPTPTGFTPQMLSVWFQAQSALIPSSVETTGGFEILLEP